MWRIWGESISLLHGMLKGINALSVSARASFQTDLELWRVAILCYIHQKMTACLQVKGGGAGMRKQETERAAWGYIPGLGSTGAASLHRCASEKCLA